MGGGRVSMGSTISTFFTTVSRCSKGCRYCGALYGGRTCRETRRIRGKVSDNGCGNELTNMPVNVGSGVYAGSVLAAYSSGVLRGFVPACGTAIMGHLGSRKVMVVNGLGVSRFTVNDAARASTAKIARGP